MADKSACADDGRLATSADGSEKDEAGAQTQGQHLLLKEVEGSSMEKSEELSPSLSEAKDYQTCRTISQTTEQRNGCFNAVNAALDKIHFPKYVLLTLTGAFLWANLWLLVGELALPGGAWFALFFLSVFSWIGGEVIGLLHLPPLLGMLIVGFALRNLPVVHIAQDLNPFISSTLRNVALAVILCRAGLSLDPHKLKKLRVTFLALSVLPCVIEAAATAIAAHLILDFSWLWSFILGFVVAGVSPAVVVPSMLICQDKRLGTNKGIPTLLIASGSLDNVTAIAAFGIVLSITFSTRSLHMTILQGPLEVVIGGLFGFVIGTVTWFYTIRIKKGRLILQCLILLLGSMFAIFGGRYVGFPGAGPLGSLVLAFVAANGWRKRGKLDRRIPIVFNMIWLIFQPILFGLIGSEVKLESLAGNTIGYGVAIVLIAVVVRSIVTYLSTARSNFCLREKLFVVLSWIPKATVQATIGPVALDTARLMAAGNDVITLGTEVLTVAVLSILLTAPIGAIAISLSSSRLLTRETDDKSATDV